MTLSFKSRRTLTNIVFYVILILVAGVVLFPLWSAFTISMLTDQEVASYPPRLWPSGLQLENFQRALQQAPLARYLLNSVIQSTIVMLGQLVTASLAAYAFAFIDFKGRNIVFFVFLTTLMIPWEATIIPNYLLIRQIGWTDTFLGLSAPFMATAFGTFLLRQFMMTIPKELLDAARIDGANNFDILVRLIAPLTVPALATCAIFTFMWNWNDFFWPLIFLTDQNKFTLSLGLYNFIGSVARTQWGLLLAAATMMTIPPVVLFFFAQKTFIQGITLTGIKG